MAGAPIGEKQRAEGSAQRHRVRLGYLVAAGVVAALAVSAVVVAAGSNPSSVAGKVGVRNLTVGPKAPARLDAKGWLNSAPMTAADFRGKVVLYDFWTFSCVNCVRTIPHVRAWWDRYRADGLVVVGVHSPEFEFEKKHANVSAAVQHLGVTWPVALDDDMTIWNAFNNQYWPAKYITDRQGRIRYRHFGEGGYDETENVVRALLGVPSSAPRAGKAPMTDATTNVVINPETYLGTDHPRPTIQAGTRDYPEPGTVTAPDVGLAGVWTAQGEYVNAERAGSSMVLGVHAREVNLVMATKGGTPVDVDVELDGKPVPVGDRGASLHAGADSKTLVTVQASDLYRLIAAPGVEDHQLRLTATAPGLVAYVFTFG